MDLQHQHIVQRLNRVRNSKARRAFLQVRHFLWCIEHGVVSSYDLIMNTCCYWLDNDGMPLKVAFDLAKKAVRRL